MNVYDFDGTIYRGDSTLDFYRFCLRRHPLLARYLPVQAWGAVLYACKRVSKTRFKEYFFSFLRGLPDVDRDLSGFWREARKNIMDWYAARRSPEDVVISASPEFLLEGFFPGPEGKRLIASRVDKRTGRCTGLNCKGAEKVRRFREAYPADPIHAFYSDSKSDLPLARLAESAFLVRNGRPVPWDW